MYFHSKHASIFFSYYLHVLLHRVGDRICIYCQKIIRYLHIRNDWPTLRCRHRLEQSTYVYLALKYNTNTCLLLWIRVSCYT